MKKKTIKEYLEFYKECYELEKKGMMVLPRLANFRKGKIYEMELVIRDLERILDGDMFFIRGDDSG